MHGYSCHLISIYFWPFFWWSQAQCSNHLISMCSHEDRLHPGRSHLLTSSLCYSSEPLRDLLPLSQTRQKHLESLEAQSPSELDRWDSLSWNMLGTMSGFIAGSEKGQDFCRPDNLQTLFLSLSIIKCISCCGHGHLFDPSLGSKQEAACLCVGKSSRSRGQTLCYHCLHLPVELSSWAWELSWVLQ